jgi:Ras-related protein Rab-1A
MKSTMNRYSLILIGNRFVGKSCLLQRYEKKKYQDDLPYTQFVNWCLLEVNGCQFEIFDTAGEEQYKSVTSTYYRRAHGVILVFDITDRESFDKIIDWRDEVLKYNENPIFLLIGNKCDEAERNIKQQEAQEMAESYSMEYIETSAKDGTNVEKIFETITRMICEGVKDSVMINIDQKTVEMQNDDNPSRVHCKC